MQRPRSEAAESYLRNLLKGVMSPRLPTIAGCARNAGVSYVTMWKAFEALRKSGELPAPAAAPPAAAPKMARWQSIREQIIRDIVEGRIAADGALTLKGIITEYGACYRTAKAAVGALEALGWLVGEKKHFRVPGPAVGGRGMTVVLLSDVNPSKSVATLSPRIQDLIRATEINCSRMRLGLKPIFIRACADSGLEIPAGDEIAGYCVWKGDLKSARLGTLFNRLAKTGKPVSLLDETGEVPLEKLPATGERTAFFSLANSAGAGRSMGRYLIGLGHERIGFFSAQKGHVWADNRHAGLCESFAAAGFVDAVKYFALESQKPDIRMGQFLRRVINDRTITAIVTVTDMLGIGCLSWLIAHGVRPGRDISVAGFDDTPDAFLHGLTSYNFNCEPTAHAMIAHIRGRCVSRKRRRKTDVVEIEGFVTPRGSTGARTR